MTKSHSLSLYAAILINVNIMLGTGTFINTVILAQHSGVLGSFLYLLAGILMLPVILCIAQLTSMHTEGNFYNFGAMINPFWGFVSSWSYFIGKLASATLSVHVFVMFLHYSLPALQTIPALFLDSGLIMLFVLLNLLHVKTGRNIQAAFFVTKCIPLLFAIGAGLYCVDLINIAAPHRIWAGIPIALPLVLFCCLGFEASCSLSKIIKDAKRNAPRAIIISFTIVIVLSILYQLLFYLALGSSLSKQASYVGAFPLLLQKATPRLLHILGPLFSLAIAVSALGGAYGIIYSNQWNLYALAEKKHLFLSEQFKKVNYHHIPIWCVLTEGIICIGYILLTKGAQIPLQYTAVLGCIIAYTISIIALFNKARSQLSVVGLITCAVLLTTCINGFVFTSLVPLYIFSGIITTGVLVFFLNKIIS